MQIEKLLSRLEGVKKSGSGWTARCPGHEDKTSSLSVGHGKDGRIVLKCFTGCETAPILAAIGLSLQDVMPEQNEQPRARETVYSVTLEDGSTVEHVRLDNPDGSKKFIWRRNGNIGLSGVKIADLPLYRPEKQTEGGPVVICEGEKAAIAACRLGLRAWGTMSGANGCPSVLVLKSICNEQDVILWADNDEPGQSHMSKIKSIVGRFAKSCAIVTTGGPKDDAADYRGSKADFLKLVGDSCVEKLNTRMLSMGVDGAIAGMIRFSIGDHSDRVPIGIKKIDQALRGGMMRGAMYLIGAMSGGGKTTFLQAVGVEAAKKGEVLFVSPEMGMDELAEREIMRRSGFSVFDRGPWVRPDDRILVERAHKAAADSIIAENLPVHIMENIEATMSEIIIEAKKLRNLRLVILDYAQEIADMDSKLARYLAVGEVGKEAIRLGRECNCPVMIASQLNAKTEKGNTEYSFRESGKLYHKANTAMIIEVKRSKEPNKNGFFDVESTRIFSMKNRGGPMFSIDVDYKPSVFRFGDVGKSNEQWAPPEKKNEQY